VLPVTLLFLLLLASAPSLAQTAPGDEAQSLLILNARLIDREGEEEDTTANLLIRAGRLSLVTKDPIPASEADRAFDAENGVLMGKLALGEPASFVILDEDPRGNVEVLLDTAAHIRFAIVKGEIVRNELARVGAEAEPERRGWLAYTPPPIALPVDYRDERKWNLFETQAISGLFVSALVIDRHRWLSQDSTSERQVGDLTPFDGGEIRGFRFGLVGTFNFKKPWVYTIFAATNGFAKGFDTETDDDYTLFDYRVDIPVFENTTISIGKQKEPISMDRLTGGAFLPMQERAAISDAILP
jgi:phosphate-selective porin OprO/OprP